MMLTETGREGEGEKWSSIIQSLPGTQLTALLSKALAWVGQSHIHIGGSGDRGQSQGLLTNAQQ